MPKYIQEIIVGRAWVKVATLLKSVFNALSEITFTPSPFVGGVILLLAFISPNVVLCGVTAVFSLFLFAALVGIKKGTLENGFYIYNPLLVGMSIGFLYEMKLWVFLFVMAAAVLTFLATVKLSAFLSKYSLPTLSLPFALVSTAVYLAASKYSHIFSPSVHKLELSFALEEVLPLFVSAFLKSLGTVVFMPDALAGLVILLIMLYHSRILSMLAVVSYVIGILLHAMPLGSIEGALSNPYSFNYILVGLALGCTFLIPSLRTYLVMSIGVGICVLMVDATSTFAEMFHIPVFTIPFNLTVLLFLYTLKLHSHKNVAHDIRTTPEESLTVHLASQQRFKGGEISIALPFAGQATVYQGVDGRWTHKDEFRYAYDFVVTDDNNSMHKNAGNNLEDYYIFGKEILSPVSGYVVAVNDALPDLEPGMVDHVNNWGNYIIIHANEGFYVEISHLMQGSLKVAVGQYVEVATPLALCGNSGFSPLPHIHIQVQKTGYLGDVTLPFNFTSGIIDNEIVHYMHLNEGDVVESIVYDLELYSRLTLKLGTVMLFDCIENGVKTGQSLFTVKRTQEAACRFYLEDEMGGKLFYNIIHNSFYFYDYRGPESSSLRQLFLTFPRIPLASGENFEWNESLPLNIFYNNWLKGLLQFTASLLPDFRHPQGVWRFDREQMAVSAEISGYGRSEHTEVILHEEFGFERIAVGNTVLQRCD